MAADSLIIRGLHLDPARRFFSTETLFAIVDRAARCGINTLHLHLSDDQGIAIESQVLNYHGGWSIAEQSAIADYCHARNIDIVPEIDIPGHSVALRSLLETGAYAPISQMGIISPGLIDIAQLPRIIALYDELRERFHAKYFHMGGDETRGAQRDYFQQIVDRVCEWGASRNVQIIAWEDALGKIDAIPANLIIHRWKHRVYPQIARQLEKIPPSRIISSVDYYLDTCIDPYTAYRKPIVTGILGCVACTWGELIGPENILHTIFPALYLLGHRWTHLGQAGDPATLLFDLCERLGWIESGLQNTWRRRQWRGFVLAEGEKIPERSTTSTTTKTRLTREEDQYPLVSALLIRMAHCIRQRQISNPQAHEDIDQYRKAMIAASVPTQIVDDIFAASSRDEINKSLRRLRRITEPEEQTLYKNGIRMVIRECLR